MAEAPAEGLFRDPTSAQLEGDRLEVTGVPPGPAGVSAVELPDGSVIEVDHADPGRLVALDLAGEGAASSPVLLAAFGGDGALELLDRAGDDADADGDPVVLRRELADDAWNDRRSMSARSAPRFPGDDAAAQFGRIVLLADLADDEGLVPFARVVAAAELAISLDRAPGGDVLAPLVPALLARADRLAAEIDPDDLPAIYTGSASPILDAFNALLVQAGVTLPGIAALVAAIQERRRRANLQVSAVADLSPPLEPLLADDHVEHGAVMASSSPPGEFVEVQRVTPTLLTVATARSEQQRWVRVLRRDGLVLLALVPLQRDGLLDRAEAIVPPDTLDYEIDVQIVDAVTAGIVGTRPADLVRRAVRAGRSAASAERANDRGAAGQHWYRCAELWAELGDLHRSDLAQQRAGTRGGQFRGRPLLSDEITWTDDPWT